MLLYALIVQLLYFDRQVARTHYDLLRIRVHKTLNEIVSLVEIHCRFEHFLAQERVIRTLVFTIDFDEISKVEILQYPVVEPRVLQKKGLVGFAPDVVHLLQLFGREQPEFVHSPHNCFYNFQKLEDC